MSAANVKNHVKDKTLTKELRELAEELYAQYIVTASLFHDTVLITMQGSLRRF